MPVLTILRDDSPLCLLSKYEHSKEMGQDEAIAGHGGSFLFLHFRLPNIRVTVHGILYL